jgi:redox-sensitive bicupin YhaK (pirin superfamily)
MEKAIVSKYGGINSKVGELLVNRLLPNRYLQAVGPFVFLDHLYPSVQQPKTPSAPTGEFAHPHRGIATFSYVFSGALEHFDSNGKHGIVEVGGAQWMKAGKGIIHDEHFSPDFQARGGIMHGLQFWINLPAINKAESPDYMAVQASDIPEVILPNNAGMMRIVIGACGDNKSPVKTYSEQFIYHIKLNPKSSFSYETKVHLEYAAFVPSEEVLINGDAISKSEIVEFGKDNGSISFTNNNITEVDIILFGGEPYAESIFAEGPFVMNSKIEIAHAYRDFFNGDYGTIEYNSVVSKQ